LGVGGQYPKETERADCSCIVHTGIHFVETIQRVIAKQNSLADGKTQTSKIKVCKQNMNLKRPRSHHWLQIEV
jgi:hypothetical protein